MNKKVKHGTLLTVIFTLLSLLYLYPIILVFINSFKKKVYISKAPFEIPTGKMYVGLENYIRGIKQTQLIQAFGWSLFITILSVAVIILCCSMCAWYICRVKTKFTKILYMLCLFAMIVPFQMEMFTLSKIANMLHMGNPWGLVVIYLGFGAGLSVFMFTGFMKSIPLEIEEAAMIDGCTPFKYLIRIVVPLSKPIIAVLVLYYGVARWNSYQDAILYLQKANYLQPLQIILREILIMNDIDETMMGNADALARQRGLKDLLQYSVIVIASVPVMIIYPFVQKYFVKGVMIGAVKG